MGKRVAILQSNYIPWKGYFDIIASVDEFIIFDDAQYTKNDWRNRNLIKTPQGLAWLTIPVLISGASLQTIREARIANQTWATNHWKTLVQNYRNAPHFNEISNWLEPIYFSETHTHISKINTLLIKSITGFLGIETKITSSRDYRLAEGKNERLIHLCRQSNASKYVTGPAAASYLDEKMFEQEGISVEWFDYRGYPEHPQLWGEFHHNVSILDLLFNCGHQAALYMKYAPQRP